MRSDGENKLVDTTNHEMQNTQSDLIPTREHNSGLTRTQRQDWFDSALLPTILQVLLWGYATLAVLAYFAMPVDRFDDSIPLVQGMLVHQGRIPDLDFYAFYPPLSLYVNAALFSFLGGTVLAVRVLAALLYFVVLLLVMRVFWIRSGLSLSLASAAAPPLAGGTNTDRRSGNPPRFRCHTVDRLSYAPP